MNEQYPAIASLRGQDDAGAVRHAITSHTPLLEWLVGAVGFLLVAGVIAYLLYQGLAGTSRPPDIQLQVEAIQSVGTNYMVSVRANNRGDKTVKGLQIEGRVKSGVPETRTLTFNYLPAQSERRGSFYFTADPRTQKFELSVQGYEHP